MDIKNYTQKILNAYSSFIKDKVLEKDIYASKENEGYVKKSETAKTLESMKNLDPMCYVGSNSEGEIGAFPFPIGSNDTTNNFQVVKLNVRAGETHSIDLLSEDKTTNSIVQCFEYFAGMENVVQTLKVFNNSSTDNFYYNKNAVDFQDGMKIQNVFKYPLKPNADGYYETDPINLKEFKHLGHMLETEKVAKTSNIPNVEGLGEKASISFESTSYHNGSNADRVDTLLDGDLSSKTAYGVLVSTNTNSHFKFTVDTKVRIHAYGTTYSDSAGSTGKKVCLYKGDELLGEYQTYIGEWYVLFDELEAGTYQLKITDRSLNYVNFTEWYVEELRTPTIIIKENDKYYSPSIANYSTETGKFNETSLSDVANGFCFIEDLFEEITVGQETFRPIDKFENPRIVSLQDSECIKLQGVKSLSELVVASKSFTTKHVENIDYFNIESELSEYGRIYVVVSTDFGKSWLTTEDCGETWIRLDNTAPTKDYELLTTEELEKWNNLKNEVIQKGIGADDLKNINFNTLDCSQLRFAYCLKIRDSYDTAINKNILWQFDSFGNMKKMNDSDVDIQLTSESIVFMSHKDADMVKINVSNGFVG